MLCERPASVAIPPDIRCAQDYERVAARSLAEATYAYLAGGSGQDRTVQANRDAFSMWSISPRILNDLRNGHTRCRLADRTCPHPILLAPVAFQQLAHTGAELETARAAAATDTCMVCSTLSSHRLEDIAQVTSTGRWFQLYCQPHLDDTLDLIRRAEQAGYEALVLTLDAAIQAPSLRAMQAGFRMPADCIPANLQGYPLPAREQVAPGHSRIFQGLMQHAPTWKDVEWLLAHTRLPIWIKGVLHPDDARRLQLLGVAGVIVSNHGGRSLDGAPATLQALPEIRKAVGESFPVLLDSGIRSGSDVFKALALGANAVLIGRLQVYALSVAGALGVAHMITLLREELEVCMAQAGCGTLADIPHARLIPLDMRQDTPC
ncbi:MAG TPA: alpha-hydroxy acid oxidase [Aquabacterium sp.]|nr:alpha-hydroxy acid oxidase [Aquabacterium sp.]